MSNSMKGMRIVRGTSQSLCIALLQFNCGALSAQNEDHNRRDGRRENCIVTEVSLRLKHRIFLRFSFFSAVIYLSMSAFVATALVLSASGR